MAASVIELFQPPPSSPAHDPAAAAVALRLIFGDRLWQLTALSGEGGETSVTLPADDMEGLSAWLDGPAASANVYFAHAERKAGATSRRKCDLVAAHWLHVDLDPDKGADLEGERARIREALSSPPTGVPAPSVILDSGRGFQALWRLEKPSADLVGVEARNRWLSAELGGDPAVFDVSRLLRLPGTINRKAAAGGRRAAVNTATDAAHPFSAFGAIGAAERSRGTPEPVVDLDRADAIAAARAYLQTAPPAIEGQGGRTAAFAVGARLKRMGLTVEAAQILALEIYDPRCSPADPEWMLERITTAWHEGEGRPGCDHPQAAFSDIAIPDLPAAPALQSAVRWADDPGASQPIEWLLKGILPRAGVGIVYGPPKSGKSFVAFDLAARLACRLPWFDVRTPKEPVGTLLLLGEGGGTVATRLQAFTRATGATVGPLAWLTVSNLSSAAGLQEAKAEIAAVISGMTTRGARLGLVIVDTLASALGLEDENSAPEVTKALKALEAIATEFDLAILGIHHAGKNGQDRGSSAFRAACDVMLSVERGEALTGQPEHRQLSVVLNRNGEGDWSTNFRLERVVLGIDDDGDEITSCTVTPASVGQVTLGRRETIMALFDPVIIHLHGERRPIHGWAIPKATIREHCQRAWGDELAKDTLRKTINRALADLLKAGRLQHLHEAGADCFVLATEAALDGLSITPAGLFERSGRDTVRDTSGQPTAEQAETQ